MRGAPDPKVLRLLIAIVPLATVDTAAVESLLDRAFGADRRERTAYKVRGKGTPIGELSFAALDEGELVGSIQCWPVALARDDGRAYPLVMVGPVAVVPERQRDGIGRRLMTQALAAADRCDEALMLIGDPEYYGRFFGFTAERTGGWRLPGPVESRRLLARGSDVPDVTGTLGPPITVPA